MSRLDETPGPLGEDALHAAMPLLPATRREVALLLHLDDLHPESLPLADARVVRIGGLLAHTPGAADRVRVADEAAMAEVLTRAAAHFGCRGGTAVQGWSDGLPVVAAWAPVGPSAAMLPEGCARARREWDDLVWPIAAGGYYQVRKAIPSVLSSRAARNSPVERHRPTRSDIGL